MAVASRTLLVPKEGEKLTWRIKSHSRFSRVGLSCLCLWLGCTPVHITTHTPTEPTTLVVPREHIAQCLAFCKDARRARRAK